MKSIFHASNAMGCRLHHVIFLVLALIGASPAAVMAQSGPIRIAVLDLDSVVSLSSQGKALAKRLEAFQQRAQAQAQAKSDEARQIRQRLVEGTNSLSTEQLAELQKLFDDKQIEMRRLSDDSNREGQKIRTEGLREIENLIQPILEKYRKEQRYDVIFNKTVGVVLMVGERIDITQEVVNQLNVN